MMTSLGNIEATGLASLSFLSWEMGDILYLTGTAKNLVGSEAQAVMPFQNILTMLYVTGYVFIKDCLPVRQRPGTEVTRSPYSPPIKLLREEVPEGSQTLFDSVQVTLTRIEVHSDDLATFSWETDKEVEIEPGQTAILDFTSLVGGAGYNHMAAWKPSAVNDDRIRTWTISSAHVAGGDAHAGRKLKGTTRTFDLTMREKPGGAVTTALFVIARKLTELKPEVLMDTRPLELRVKLVGIAGEFTLPSPLLLHPTTTITPRSFLWIAGGIGITPFISMLTALNSLGSVNQNLSERVVDIDLVLATREPAVLLPLIYRALSESVDGVLRINLTLHIFSSQRAPLPFSVSSRHIVTVQTYSGRIPNSFFETTFKTLGSPTDSNGEVLGRKEVYLCGPRQFEEAVMDGLGKAGVDKKDVRREGFAY